MMFWYGHDFSAWGWVGMTIGMIAFWALVVAGIAWLIRSFQNVDRRQVEDERGPERLLAERFARGEIDETEYQHRLAVLRGESKPWVVRS